MMNSRSRQHNHQVKKIFVPSPSGSRSVNLGVSKMAGQDRVDEDWRRDEVWTAITGYLAQMYLPGEG